MDRMGIGMGVESPNLSSMHGTAPSFYHQSMHGADACTRRERESYSSPVLATNQSKGNLFETCVIPRGRKSCRPRCDYIPPPAGGYVRVPLAGRRGTGIAICCKSHAVPRIIWHLHGLFLSRWSIPILGNSNLPFSNVTVLDPLDTF